MSHWGTEHKNVCKKLIKNSQKEIKLERPPILPNGTTINPRAQHASKKSTKSLTSLQPSEGFQKPHNVAIDETFYVKVQGGSPIMPLMIYDETRQCFFQYPPGLKGYDELRQKVNAEPAFDGRKTYMKASFNKDGECTVYPSTATLRKW